MHGQKTAFNKIDMDKIKEEDEEDNQYDDFRKSHNKGWADEYNSGMYGNHDLYSDCEDEEDEKGPKSSKMKMDNLYAAAGLKNGYQGFDEDAIKDTPPQHDMMDPCFSPRPSMVNQNDWSNQEGLNAFDKVPSFIKQESNVTTNAIIFDQVQDHQQNGIMAASETANGSLMLSGNEQQKPGLRRANRVTSAGKNGPGAASSDSLDCQPQRVGSANRNGDTGSNSTSNPIDSTCSNGVDDENQQQQSVLNVNFVDDSNDSSGLNGSNDDASQQIYQNGNQQSQLEQPPVDYNEAAAGGSGIGGGMGIGDSRPKFAKVIFENSLKKIDKN
jgi:hypothetical protein